MVYVKYFKNTMYATKYNSRYKFNLKIYLAGGAYYWLSISFTNLSKKLIKARHFLTLN